MLAVTDLKGARLVPLIRYRNVEAAIEWLGNAFGFEKHIAVTGQDGRIVYAQLKLGDALVMLSPVEGSGLEGIMKQPDEIGGAATQCSYLVVADVAAHCERAKAAGAEILMTEVAEADPRRGYSCRDLEGHVWSFGSFDPWHNAAREPELPLDAPAPAAPPSAGRRALSTVAMLAVLLIAGTVTVMIDPAARELYDKVTGEIAAAVETAIAENFGTWNGEAPVASVPQPVAAARQGATEPAVASDLDPQATLAGQQLAIAERLLALQKGAREAAESAARKLADQLAREKLDKESALKTLENAKRQLAAEKSAKESAERAARETGEKLAKAERISASWMLRAEEAEAKAMAAADPERGRDANIETGSPGPAERGAASPPNKPGAAAEAHAAAKVAEPENPQPAPAITTNPVPPAPAAAQPVPAKPAARPRVSRARPAKKVPVQEPKTWGFVPW